MREEVPEELRKPLWKMYEEENLQKLMWFGDELTRVLKPIQKKTKVIKKELWKSWKAILSARAAQSRELDKQDKRKKKRKRANERDLSWR